MAKKILVNLDLSKNELQNAVLQPLASAPSSPTEGQMYYNTTDDTPYIYANGEWLDMGVQGGGGSGTVTSVAISGSDGIEVDSGSPITDSGTIALGVNAATLRSHINVEDGADVTDAANVAAAGAVMESDTSTAAMSFVIDEDNMASNSATKVPTQQSVKAYVDSGIAAVVDSAPAALDTLNELAAALGDDENFATTTATAIGTKLTKADNLSDVANAATAFGNIKQAASATATGVVELATQAEAQAKTDTTRALTPASVADFARKVTGTIGNGSLTDLPVTHGLGTQWVTAQVYEVSTGAQVECDVVVTSSTVVTFSFAVAPTTNQYRYVIVG